MNCLIHACFRSTAVRAPVRIAQGLPRWEFDPALVAGPEKSLDDDALLPLTKPEFKREHAKLLRELKKKGVPLTRPFAALSSGATTTGLLW
jgi:hypothetical protein